MCSIDKIEKIPKHIALTFPRTYSRVLSQCSFYRNPMNRRLLIFTLISDILKIITYIVEHGVEIITVDFLPRDVIGKLGIDLTYVENILTRVLYRLNNVNSQIVILEDSYTVRRIFFEPREGFVKLNIVVGYDRVLEVERSIVLLTLKIGEKIYEHGGKVDLLDIYNLSRDFRESLIIQEDPDLMIVFGDKIFPNFIPFNLAYSELVFIDKEITQVDRKDIEYAILEYSKRCRRFGR